MPLVTREKNAFPLPPELLLEVLSYLNHSQTSLHAASLVCKEWLFCATPILYGHPKILDTYRWATFILTLTRQRMSFFYGHLVRSIDLSSGKSIDTKKDQEFYRRLSDTASNSDSTEAGSSSTQARNVTITITRNQIIVEDNQTETEHDFVVKGLPYIIVSTSSLIQVASTCKNITHLNLSSTSLLHDSQVVETGEYLSTLQHFVQPGLTQVQISIETAIESIGRECKRLTHIKIQRCEWVTAHVIWMFAYYCPYLQQLDARRSFKCTVKRLINNVLEASHTIPTSTTNTTIPPPTSSSSSSSPSSSSSHSYASSSSSSPTHWRRHPPDIINSFLSTDRMYSNYHHHMHYNLNRNQVHQRRLGEYSTEGDEEEPHYHRLEDELYERLENLMETSQTMGRHAGKTLKNLVYDILLDAKDLGAVDLNWLQQYVGPL
ncbi:hypothetical protein A0J61_06484 [Choanephora cucurbitarum]|uniref:F-box domain-containing protein n=1 Tax=Choanephora cucurbitarum TaxID=101091 RepID=A0A1C7N8N6_9FUNG|nr:hypothetical protein A0J61_06484 [Choanephora cucurbitarum]